MGAGTKVEMVLAEYDAFLEWTYKKGLLCAIYVQSGILRLRSRNVAGIEYNGIPTNPNVTTHLNWPWIAVYVDGELSFKQEIGREAMSVFIYKNCGNCKERHTIKIIKLTENLKTQLGIKCLEFDGEVKSVNEDKKKRIEFIGDSITCGFGNMTDERDRWFYTMDEDATNSHGPLAAEKQHNDYVVLNLGTNDATGISFALKQAEEYEHFKIGYRKLVETIRQANGSNTHIICALGTMTMQWKLCVPWSRRELSL